MKKPFIYGTAVAGDNFTDRVKETKRLKLCFENGLNTILISPRRMGKTSLVNKVANEITDEEIKIIRMDIYDCRDGYRSYRRVIQEWCYGTVSSEFCIIPDSH